MLQTAHRAAAILLLLAGAIVPPAIASFFARPPAARAVHIEAYRYGFQPSRIHAQRGDRLRLTFSARDTGQSFFLQDYDLHVAISPGASQVAVMKLSAPEAPPTYADYVDIVAGEPGPLVSKSQYRNHTYNGPLHGTERGDLIVAPNLLLWAGVGVLCMLPASLWLVRSRANRAERRFNLFERFPRLKRVLKAPSFQFNLTLPMLAVFWFIILAGLIGTKVAGRNAGPMMIWVLWLSGLIILLVPVGGRLWCTVCPLPILGEAMQRRRQSRHPEEIESPRRRWPRALSSAWPRVLLFLLLGTFSTNIVALPPATSWMLIALVLMAVATSFLHEPRVFCRYLCPINSYISLYSATGRVIVRAVSQQACDNCSEHFCLTGSVKGWGCPYGLCMGEVNRNNDCGACMECVKTCAYDNVAVFWRSSGWDRQVPSYAEAWQAIVMFFLACLYCFVNLGAWDQIRDWTDLLDKQNWTSFAIYAAAVWVVALGALPLIWYLLAARRRVYFRESTAALVPIGLACWIAFALATLLGMTTFVLQSLSDPFNWGWNLLGMAGSRWRIYLAPAIPWMQVVCILVGAAYSIRTLYEVSRRKVADCWPLAGFLLAASGAMIVFFAG